MSYDKYQLAIIEPGREEGGAGGGGGGIHVAMPYGTVALSTRPDPLNLFLFVLCAHMQVIIAMLALPLRAIDQQFCRIRLIRTVLCVPVNDRMIGDVHEFKVVWCWVNARRSIIEWTDRHMSGENAKRRFGFFCFIHRLQKPSGCPHPIMV